MAFRKPQDGFVNDTKLQITLREMHRLATDRRSWVVLLGLSVVIGLIGPFGSFEAMAIGPRLAYWTAIVLGTAAAGTLVASFLEQVLEPRLPRLPAALLAGAAAGPGITAFVVFVNYVAFGPGLGPVALVQLLVYCTAISATVTLVGALLHPVRSDPSPVAASSAPPTPAILERLPLPQRGALLHIAVSDHYVDVTTDRGTILVLMRLSDAIRETTPVPGLQVHRSHWVALAAVRRTTRRNGKLLLELTTGTEVPVSRTYLAAVREAGLLA